MILSKPERQVTGLGGTGRSLKACAGQRDGYVATWKASRPRAKQSRQKCLLVWAVPWDPLMLLHTEGPVQKPAKIRPPPNPRRLGHQQFRAALPFISLGSGPPGSDGHKCPHFTDEETERDEVTCLRSRHSWTVTVDEGRPPGSPQDTSGHLTCVVLQLTPPLPASRPNIRGPLCVSL